MKNLFLIGVCGRSCCGKDNIVQRITSVNPHVLHINTDLFFKTKSNCGKIKGYECWEHEDVIRWDHLYEVLTALKNGKGTIIQDRSPWWGSYNCEIYPDDISKYNIMIVQGYLLFTDEKIHDLFNNMIFVDVNDENILYRRVQRNNTIEGINYIHDVVIPASKEYQDKQKAAADKIFDSNFSTINALADDLIKYINLQLYTNKFEDNLVVPNVNDERLWQVHPGDLLSDHEWHPIDFNDLKDHAQKQKQALDSGSIVQGNTFEYRKNQNTDDYEVRLSLDGVKYRHIFRYTRKPTLPKNKPD
jgi:uridine kinase